MFKIILYYNFIFLGAGHPFDLLCVEMLMHIKRLFVHSLCVCAGFRQADDNQGKCNQTVQRRGYNTGTTRLFNF